MLGLKAVDLDFTVELVLSEGFVIEGVLGEILGWTGVEEVKLLVFGGVFLILFQNPMFVTKEMKTEPIYNNPQDDDNIYGRCERKSKLKCNIIFIWLLWNLYRSVWFLLGQGIYPSIELNGQNPDMCRDLDVKIDIDYRVK